MKLLRPFVLLRPLRNNVFPRSTVNTPIPRKDNSAEIDRKGHVGKTAPFAYQDTYEYPEDYQPWNWNYKGYGVMLALLSMSCFALYAYERSFLNRTGYTERPKDRLYYHP